MTFAYLRAGQSGQAIITTEKLLKDKGEEAALRTWGITAQRITERAAQLRKLPSTLGAVVTSLRSGGPAEQSEPKIGWGDVIRSIDGTPINSLHDLIDKYKQIDALKSKPEYVLIEFEREGKSYLTLLKPKPEDQPDFTPEVRKAWIGVATQPIIDKMAEKMGDSKARGFRVMRVYSDTNAAKAGLKVGDIISSIDDSKIQPKNLSDAGGLVREVQADVDRPERRGSGIDRLPGAAMTLKLDPRTRRASEKMRFKKSATTTSR